jgi:ElaB/YqjD/DUF883 family membrane-anchored ribosome-binding protein
MHGESEAEVLQRIEATRERMGETISRIGDRVNPDRVQRELKDNIKQKARDTMRGIEDGVSEKGRGIWHAIRENPLPAGMIGIGLAWLVANANRDDDMERGRTRPYRYTPDRPYGDPAFGYPTGGRAEPYPPEYYGRPAESHAHGRGEQVRDRAHEMVDDVRERASDAADSIRSTADDAVHKARDTASDVADRASDAWHEAQDRVEHVTEEVGYRARRVERRVEHMVEENPLAAGMVAAALGFAAGLVIPETQKEHEVMGEARDRLVHKAQHAVHEAKDTARDVARETASATAKKAVDEAFGDGEDRGHSPHSPMTGPGR